MHDAHIEALDLRSLRLLATLLETASISKTGEAFHLSQPAASRAVQRLRRALRDPLLVRGARGYVLTARAEALRSAVAAAQASLDAVFTHATFDPARSTRAFRIAASEYALVSAVPAIVRALRERAPGASLAISPVSEHTFEQIEDGSLDCAFWGDRPPPHPYRSRELFRDRFIGFVSADHPLASRTRRQRITLDAYLSFPHVMVGLRGPGRSPIDVALDAIGRKRSIAVAAPNFMACAACLTGTDLIMSLPSRLADAVRTPEFVSFSLPLVIQEFPYWMVWHQRTDGDPAIDWLNSIMLSSFGSA